MKYNYLALIQGGLGPDVWDKEMQISAVDFRDAANQATARAEELCGQVVELSQHVGVRLALRFQGRALAATTG